MPVTNTSLQCCLNFTWRTIKPFMTCRVVVSIPYIFHSIRIIFIIYKFTWPGLAVWCLPIGYSSSLAYIVNFLFQCGDALELDAEAIKKCAKGPEGTQLLKKFGELSAVVNFKYVPYVLVNGVISKSQNLLDDICSSFKNPPDTCTKNQ